MKSASLGMQLNQAFGYGAIGGLHPVSWDSMANIIFLRLCEGWIPGCGSAWSYHWQKCLMFTVQLQPKLCHLTSASLCGPGTERTELEVFMWQWYG